MDDKDIRLFLDPSNVVVHLLIAHFLALQCIMAPILDREYGQRGRMTPLRYHLSWIDSILDLLPPNMKHLMEWPKAVADCVRDELNGKQAPVTRMSILRKKEGFSRRFAEGVSPML